MTISSEHHEIPLTRRDMLVRGGAGFGALALASLLGGESKAENALTAPSAKQWRLPAAQTRAKSVIFLFMEGGPSHIDLFDPKPELTKRAGQRLPASIKRVVTPMGETESPLLALPRKWKQHGQNGIWVSDWLPHMANIVDDITIIRSCWGNGLNHVGGCCQMNTGSVLAGRPSLGSWVSYGLGTENQNLPAFVVIRDRKLTVAGGPRNWGPGFMPAAHQGIEFQSEGDPIPNLNTSKLVGASRQDGKLGLIRELNQEFAGRHPEQSELDARIKSYELACRMQLEAPLAINLNEETEETRELYGINNETTSTFGRNCLLARRLVERGVRFVQLYHGAGSKWDSHTEIEKNHSRQCLEMDKPVTGLMQDLKRRGLLEDTLVVWGGEFGRTPMSEKGNGRDHNPYGFTMWFAGAGVPQGQVIGKTDDFGLHAIEDRMHVHDLHATILRIMGVDHSKLVYLHKGRPERPTLNEGNVLDKIIS